MLPSGESVKVEDVDLWDIILSSWWPVEVMKTYTIEYEWLVHSLNGSDYFVTSTHPFMTTEWWKSFDPLWTKIESPNLEVSLLEIGDILIKKDGTHEQLISSDAQYMKTTVYNFWLNGTRDYYADDYRVHNVDTNRILAHNSLSTKDSAIDTMEDPDDGRWIR